jgi:hypothetical protein
MDFAKKVPGDAEPILNENRKMPVYSQFNETVPGLMTTTVESSTKTYSLVAYPTNLNRLNEFARNDFPCEEYVKGYKGEMSVFVFISNAIHDRNEQGVPTSVYYGDATTGDPSAISIFNLGTLEIFDRTDQYGFVGQLVPASRTPLIDLIGYTKRVSCEDSNFYGFIMNSYTDKLQQVHFVDKAGNKLDYVTIPKGRGIPQRDSEGNVIGDKSISNSEKRLKTRYKFNDERLEYREIESWTQ